MKRFLAIVFMAGLFALFLYLVAGMPPMGDSQNPTAQNVVPRYIEGAQEEAGAENVVTAVVLNYRGYDTLGEVTVIFTAMAGVLAVLGKERKERIHAYTDYSKVRSSTIVRTFLYFLVPFIVLFSVYVILHGLITPGGGFQGGTIIGASMIIFTAIFGLWDASKRISQRIRVPLETGAVLIFYIIGWVGIIGGGDFPDLSYAPAAQFRATGGTRLAEHNHPDMHRHRLRHNLHLHPLRNDQGGGRSCPLITCSKITIT